jgi:murein DD-endopeptidase MepM/ murein hydrolase activator NlpD
LKRKQTFYQWLTTKVTLQVRDDESFAYKMNIRLTYSALIIAVFVLFTSIFCLSLIVSNQLVLMMYEPGKYEVEQKKELIHLMEKVDSLQNEADAKEKYIANIKNIISGGQPTLHNEDDEKQNRQQIEAEEKQVREKTQVQDVTSKDTKPNDIYLVANPVNNSLNISKMYFFPPITGIITSGYNPKINHFGVDIVAKSSEPIKAIADGTVIFSSWTYDTGYVIGLQHKNDLVSVYKHNSELLKKVGNFVKAGEVVAIIGNTGELSSGPHLHFEVWYRGNPMNPEDFINFWL